MERTMKTALALSILVLLLAVPSAGGPRLDALLDTVVAHRTSLQGLATHGPRSEKAKLAGLALVDQAILEFGDADTERALATLGKGLAQLEKAAKIEVGGSFASGVRQAAQQIFAAAIAMFVPDIDKASSPEDVLAKRLRAPLSLAAQQRYGKAVGKLAKAWPALLVLEPNP
jgi:hypothetical protein